MFSKLTIETVSKTSNNMKNFNIKNLQKIKDDYFTLMSIAHANGFKVNEIKSIINKTKTK